MERGARKKRWRQKEKEVRSQRVSQRRRTKAEKTEGS